MTDDDSLEALAFGEIQMIAISLSKFDRLTQAFQVFDLPFLFPDIRAVENFQASIEGKALLEALVDSGFLGLAFWHNGMKHFGAHRPLRLPDDAQGLRFRIMESDVGYWWKSSENVVWGGISSATDWSDRCSGKHLVEYLFIKVS